MCMEIFIQKKIIIKLLRPCRRKIKLIFLSNITIPIQYVITNYMEDICYAIADVLSRKHYLTALALSRLCKSTTGVWQRYEAAQGFKFEMKHSRKFSDTIQHGINMTYKGSIRVYVFGKLHQTILRGEEYIGRGRFNKIKYKLCIEYDSEPKFNIIWLDICGGKKPRVKVSVQFINYRLKVTAHTLFDIPELTRAGDDVYDNIDRYFRYNMIWYSEIKKLKQLK